METAALRRLAGFAILPLAALCALALAAADSVAGAPANDPWPRQFVTAQGSAVTVYPPQIETLAAGVVTGRVALAVAETGDAAARFGVATFAGDMSVDAAADTAILTAVKVGPVRLLHAAAAQERRITSVVQQELPRWQLATSYGRFRETLRVAEGERQSAVGLRHDPPAVVFAEAPTVLLTFDGAPVLEDVTAEGWQWRSARRSSSCWTGGAGARTSPAGHGGGTRHAIHAAPGGRSADTVADRHLDTPAAPEIPCPSPPRDGAPPPARVAAPGLPLPRLDRKEEARNEN